MQPTHTNAEVGEPETRPTDTNAEVGETERPTDTNFEVGKTGKRPDTNAEVADERKPTNTNAEGVEVGEVGEFGEIETRPTDTNAEVGETEARPTDTNNEGGKTERRPDLVWDAEAPGLWVRVYGNGAKSFIFVYRRDDRQHFIRIGTTPVWSLEAARERAKKLRSILDQGGNPASYQKQNNVAPVENVIRYIAEHLQAKP